MLKKASFLFFSLFCLSHLHAQAKSNTLIPESIIAQLLKSYSEDEKMLIEADLSMLRTLIFSIAKPTKNGKPQYVGTAGGPLSRKTTILEKTLSEDALFQGAVYLDPDARGLKLMANTYISKSMTHLDIYKKQDMQIVRKEAYERWRDASNFITNALLNEAYAKKYDIAHGTTLTGAASPTFLKNLKDAGYEITLLLAFAPTNFKEQALKFRHEVQGFYQATPEDTTEKAKLFPQRMKDYFSTADHLRLFWTEEFSDKISPCATWSKATGLQVLDKALYEKIVDSYTQFQKKSPELAPWDSLIN
ncbi:MAG: zeta toxin family protein [Oligoflexales bacterium]|nr:zeta toxin family protein [Oligoflexales bacterium]